MLKKIFVIGFLLSVLLPFATASASTPDPSFPFWGPILSCTGNYNQTINPVHGPVTDTCQSVCDILVTGKRAIYFAMTILLFIVAPILFVIGAFMMIISAGSQLWGKGRKVIIDTAVGVLIVMCASLILTTFLWLIGNNDTQNVPLINEATGQPELNPDGTQKLIQDPNKPRVSWPDIHCDPTRIPGIRITPGDMQLPDTSEIPPSASSTSQ